MLIFSLYFFLYLLVTFLPEGFSPVGLKVCMWTPNILPELYLILFRGCGAMLKGGVEKYKKISLLDDIYQFSLFYINISNIYFAFSRCFFVTGRSKMTVVYDIIMGKT